MTTWLAGRAPPASSRLCRGAIEGGNYWVVVSLLRTVLSLLSPGIFDKAYAQATAPSTYEHRYADSDPFTAETPYQGMMDQVVLSRTAAFRTVLVPRGARKPQWLVS